MTATSSQGSPRLLVLRSLLSHYRHHPLQAVFLLVGIVIANVLLVGTLLINAQARSSYADGEQILASSTAGTIRAADGSALFDESLYLQLRRQGLNFIAPVLRRVVVSADSATSPLEIIGTDPLALPLQGATPAGDNDALSPPYAVFVAPARMQQLGWTASDRPLLDSGAILPPITPLSNAGLGHQLVTDIGSLQELTGHRGLLSSIAVMTASEPQLNALLRALPDTLTFEPATTALDQTALTDSFHLNLAAMGLLSFVVGVFLSFNAIAFSYTERTTMVRLLRLAGVTRGELAWSLLLELTLFALLGAALGYWLGAQLASVLLPGVGTTLAQLYNVYIDYPDQLFGRGWLAPLVMTFVAAAGSAAFPLRTLLNAPVTANSNAGWQQDATLRRDRWLLLAGLTLLFAAWTLSVLATSLTTALAAMACLLLGAAMLLPITARLLLWVLARGTPPRRPLLRWLVADTRWLLGPAALALMAMTLALVANSGLNTMISSFRAATDTWLQQRLVADVYLTAEVDSSQLKAWLANEAPTVVVAERRQRDKPVVTPSAGQSAVEIVSLPEQTRFLASVELFQFSNDAQRHFADGQGLYISERAWRIEGWSIGDRVQLCPALARLPIVGIYRNYGNPKPQWMLTESAYLKCWPQQEPSGIALWSDQQVDWNDVGQRLSDHLSLADGQWIDQVALKNVGLSVFDRTFAVTQVLNVLTVLVAGIGIFCAVSAIHHHRMRWQALLSALGVSAWQRLSLYIGQWSLLAVLCLVVVAPFGLALSAMLGLVVTPVAFGWSFPLLVNWGHWPALAMVGLGSVIAAVLIPGLRLIRTTPAILLREAA